MTTYYPGSKKTRKQYDGELPEPVEEELDLGKPRTYLLQGKPVELYPLGAVARALNRQPVTVRKLEQEGVIPRATMILPSHDERGTRRLYTREQIEGLRQVAQEEGVLNPNTNGKWKSIENTNFREKALKVFKENK